MCPAPELRPALGLCGQVAATSPEVPLPPAPCLKPDLSPGSVGRGRGGVPTGAPPRALGISVHLQGGGSQNPLAEGEVSLEKAP